MGVFSALGTFALMILFAATSGAYGIVFGDLGSFFTGNTAAVAAHQTAPLLMAAVILAVVTLELPLCIGSSMGVNAILGKPIGAHALEFLYRRMPRQHMFLHFFALTFGEELFARWLFLGLIPLIPGLDGPVAFFILFLLGNGIWAVIHLRNFDDSSDRNPLRVLPQFVSGIAFTYIFVKFGFIAAVLCHFASNSVIFALIKHRDVNGFFIARLIVLALTAMIAYSCMTHDISEIAPWFQRTPQFELAGWEFWDYVKASVFLGYTISFVLTLLLYDNTRPSRDSGDSLGLLGLVIVLFLGSIITVAMYYGGFQLLGLFVNDMLFRVVLLALLMAMLLGIQSSPSSLSKSFWSCITGGYIGVCVMMALGFWPAVWYVLVAMLISLPHEIINKLDED